MASGYSSFGRVSFWILGQPTLIPNHIELEQANVTVPFDFVITVCDDAGKNCRNFRGKVGKRPHRLPRSREVDRQPGGSAGRVSQCPGSHQDALHEVLPV